MHAEYRAVCASQLPSAEQLTRFAQEGWRLVQIIHDPKGYAGKRGAYVLYLVRETEDAP
jgi:predicted RNA-binding protein YlxR (DUF448 family)